MRKKAEMVEVIVEVKDEHAQVTTHRVVRYHPNHDQRTQSHKFTLTKKYWHEKGTKCYIGARCEGQIEIHHKHVEWSDSNGVNWDKMKLLHPDFDWSTFTKPEDFVDSIYNTVVLCEKHHRHEDHGIHCMPGPDWEFQRYERDDFVFSPDEPPLEKHGDENESKN